MIMRIAFYCRKGGTTFGCMLPEEKERLHAFFAAEQKREAAKNRNGRRQNSYQESWIVGTRKNKYFFVVDLT